MSRPIERDELKCELFLEVLRSIGTARFAATGSSMLPAMWPGDILEVRRETVETIQPGQVVLFRRDDRLFAHRVVGQVTRGGRIFLITRGDRLEKADQAVSSEELLGRVTAIERGGRRVSLRARRFTQCAAWILCHSQIATGVLLHINERVRHRRLEQSPLQARVRISSTTGVRASTGVSAASGVNA